MKDLEKLKKAHFFRVIHYQTVCPNCYQWKCWEEINMAGKVIVCSECGHEYTCSDEYYDCLE